MFLFIFKFQCYGYSFIVILRCEFANQLAIARRGSGPLGTVFRANFNLSNSLDNSANISSVLTNMLACTTGRHRPLSQEDMSYAAYRGSDPRNRLSTHSLDSAPIGPYGSNTQGGSRYATLPARTKGWHAVHC